MKALLERVRELSFIESILLSVYLTNFLAYSFSDMTSDGEEFLFPKSMIITYTDSLSKPNITITALQGLFCILKETSEEIKVEDP